MMVDNRSRDLSGPTDRGDGRTRDDPCGESESSDMVDYQSRISVRRDGRMRINMELRSIQAWLTTAVASPDLRTGEMAAHEMILLELQSRRA